MKYVAWEVIPGTCLPMMEDDNGELFGTNKTVSDGLGVNPSTLRTLYQQNKEEFDSLSVLNTDAKEFLRLNKSKFDISRVRSDMRMWTEDDMLTFAFLAKSDKGREFRRNLRKFIKINAVRHYVSLEEHNKLKNGLSEIKEQMHTMSLLILQNQQAVKYDASLAGKLLSNHRKTKEFRMEH